MCPVCLTAALIGTGLSGGGGAVVFRRVRDRMRALSKTGPVVRLRSDRPRAATLEKDP
jgi:hypothetical protein